MLRRLINRFIKNEVAQGFVEYGLILALVSVVSIASLSNIGGKVNNTFGGLFDPSEDEYPNFTAMLYSGEEIDTLVVSYNYIPVSSAKDLQNIANGGEGNFAEGTKWEGTYTSGLDKKYIQISDINLIGTDNFEPISIFSGSFNGGGYIINNLNIDKVSDDFVGLFGRADGALFENIGLENVNVKGRSCVGALVGLQKNHSTIHNSYAKGVVYGRDNGGGLIGRQEESSKVMNSYSMVEISGDTNIGGLLGHQEQFSSVESTYSTGNVIGVDRTGGLVGWQGSSSTVSNSYSTGKVSGTLHIGGLVGWTGKHSLVKDSGWASDICPDFNGVGRYETSGSSSNLVGRTKIEIDALIKTISK